MKIILEKKTALGVFTVYDEKPDFSFSMVHQVHGNEVCFAEIPLIKADGIISNDQNEKLCIKTADCLPILLESNTSTSFIHAGWRGLHSQILNHSHLKIHDFQYAYIGPSIRSCCFEVSEDFKDHFPQSLNFKEINNILRFDLQDEAAQQLEARFPGIKIEIAQECTCCDNRFHSYRRNKTDKRLWNIYQRTEKYESK